MLGRGVAEAVRARPFEALVAAEVRAAAAEADVFVANLECCISERGEPWPGRVFHFRAPPIAAEFLAWLGVDCVTLANNHALDYGREALLDTLDHLRRAGIAHAGAGPDEEAARAPTTLEGLRVVGVADHPEEYAARPGRPGIAYAPLDGGELPDWLAAAAADALVTPHWGPNMIAAPLRHVRNTAAALVDAGALLVAGHSAHVFHGVAGRVLYDLGDFLDDYAVNEELRNDLGLLWLVSLGERRLAAIPLKLEYTRTRLADGEDAQWIRRRFARACAALGTDARVEDGRLVVELA